METQIEKTNATLDALRKAADISGSKSALAKSVGVTPQAVTQWFNGSRPIPPGRCRLIEKATNGAITRCDLRPDIFGTPEDEDAA